MFLTLLSAVMLHREHTLVSGVGFIYCAAFIYSLGLCVICERLSLSLDPSLSHTGITVAVTRLCAGLSLVVGLVLYISSINDEVMNRPREPEQFFNYHYGWSFAFAASSFLLKEVSLVLTGVSPLLPCSLCLFFPSRPKC